MRLFFIGCLFLIANLAFAKTATLDLSAKGEKLSLIYFPCESKKQHGSILLLAGGAPWDGSLILMHLASSLSKMGWSVALFDLTQHRQWPEQLPDILVSLRKQSSKKAIIIHYGAQLQTLVDYFSKLQAKRVNGLVLLSAFNEGESKTDLQKIPFPLLDIIGQFDYETIKEQLKLRQEKTKKRRYKSVSVPGALHDYLYHEKSLATYLHSWMVHLPVTKRMQSPL